MASENLGEVSPTAARERLERLKKACFESQAFEILPRLEEIEAKLDKYEKVQFLLERIQELEEEKAKIEEEQKGNLQKLEKLKQMMRQQEPLVEFIRVASMDTHEAEKNLSGADTQYNRRTFVRAFFAEVEGLSYLRRQIALLRHEVGNAKLCDAEVALLKEVEFYLNGKGNPLSRERFLKTKEGFLFSFHILAMALQSSFILDIANSGWESFQELLEVRNRITHPKVAEDLIVSDTDIKHLRKAVAWHENNSAKLFQEC